MTTSKISTDASLKPFAASLAALLAAMGSDAVSPSLLFRDSSAIENFLANEQRRIQSLAESRFIVVKRILKTLRLHRFFHEINTFVATDSGVLIGYLLHQGNAFMRRCMANNQQDLSPQVIATIAALQQQLQVKSHRLHQQPCLSTTTVKRAALVKEHLTPAGKVLCLGDDDFVSVALALMVENEITVLDLDPQVISLIEQISAQRHLRITTHIADIRQPLPDQLRTAFDVVVADPIYFVNEMLLFLSAAEMCLRKSSSSALLSCCSRAMAGPAWQAVDAWMASCGLVDAKWYNDFNEYPKPARTQTLMALGERLLCRTRLTRACVAIPYAYSDLVVFRFRD